MGELNPNSSGRSSLKFDIVTKGKTSQVSLVVSQKYPGDAMGTVWFGFLQFPESVFHNSAAKPDLDERPETDYLNFAI